MIKLESTKQFEQLKNEHTVFLFSAKWCPDCRYIEPFLPEVEKMYSTFQFVYVDRDDFLDLCIAHDVYGIPSFLVYKDGKLSGSFVSKMRKTKKEIIDFLTSIQ